MEPAHGPTDIIMRCFCLLVLMGLYAFFKLSTTAITRSRTKRLRELEKENYFCAHYARMVLMRADTHLLAAQVGSFLSALLTGLAVLWLLRAQGWQSFLQLVDMPPEVEQMLLTPILILLLSFIALCLVQVAKSLAFARPNRVLCLISLPIMGISWILYPGVWLLRETIGRVLNAIGLSIAIDRELAASAEEISELVELSSKAGQIEDDEREMIQHVFTFSDTIAREVMTPRKDIISVEETASVEEVISLFVRERLSRILVTGSDLDDVKGVLLAKDFMSLIGKATNDIVVKKFIRPAFFVPNSKKVDDLLQELRKEALHFAVVLDEHGGVDGVVTLEDLVEEIVGEIFDEFDSPLEEADVKKTKSGDLIVDGSTIIDDLNSTYHLTIPKGEYDTIAGFVIHLLGRIPKAGEQVRYEDLILRVEEAQLNRVTSIRISPARSSSETKNVVPETQVVDSALPEKKYESSTTPIVTGTRIPGTH